MNKIFISGNLIKDPEIRYTQNGKAMAKMSIAVRRTYRSKTTDNNQPDSDFFNMTAWEKTAEFCGRYLTKGSRVLVEGRMTTYTYEGQDGSKRYGFDINVDSIEFADSKRTDGNFGGRSNYKKDSADNSANNFDEGFSGEAVSDDDVPF